MAKTTVSSSLSANRKKEFYVNGVFMNNLTAFDVTPNADEATYAVYGSDNDISRRTDTSTRIVVTALSAEGRDAWERALMGIDPLSTGTFAVDPNKRIPVAIWENERNAENTEYVRSVWYGYWRPSPVSSPQGGPNDDAQVQFEGLADVAIAFNGMYIDSDLINLGSSGSNYTGTLEAAFDTTSKWSRTHLAVIIRDDSNPPNIEALPYRDDMVSGTSVTITPDDLVGVSFTPTKALVIGIRTAAGAGVYPISGKQESLWASSV